MINQNKSTKEEIIGYDALWESMLKCQHGVRWKPSVKDFIINAPEEVFKMHKRLKNETWTDGTPRPIKIMYPKKRDGLSISFTDRVYQRSINDNVLYPDMISKVLEKQHIHGNSGYNPGSQMVQIAALTALNDLDHIIKEQLHIRHYIRYNDDFWILHESKEFLENCLEFIKMYLEGQGFELNTRKTVLKRLDAGFVFLGFNYRITETGKVIMILNSDNVKHEKKKLRRMVNKCKRGEMLKAKIDESYNDWKEFANEGNSYKLIQRMDEYYAELWRDL